MMGQEERVHLGFFSSFFFTVEKEGGWTCSLIFFLFFPLLRGRGVEVQLGFFLPSFKGAGGGGAT